MSKRVTVVRRELTCPCGQTFMAQKVTARYCSQACFRQYSRFGQSYGMYEARRFGVTK